MEETEVCVEIGDESALARLASQLAAAVSPGLLITLSGPLAAGKTTFARAFLRALGHQGKVKSPTFTLVESYAFPALTVHHFDLYRLEDPQELYFLGFEDYLKADTLCLIEWPEKGEGMLPPADLAIAMTILDLTRRRLIVAGRSNRGRQLLSTWIPPTVL